MINMTHSHNGAAQPHVFRPNLPPLPFRMKFLPADERGPIPWFVKYIDGKPDFRVLDGDKMVEAIYKRLCWCCGQTLGKYMTFVSGPMSAVNRISGEPPSHYNCAEFAAKACPFLSMPKMRRRENDLPDGVQYSPHMGTHNPGVALLWTTHEYRVIQPPKAGFLFEIGNPACDTEGKPQVEWYAIGRPATRAEVEEALDMSLPHWIKASGLDPDDSAEIERARLAVRNIAARFLPRE